MAVLFSRLSVIFILTTALNALLAYSSLDWPIKLSLGLLGFGPLVWVYLKSRPSYTPQEPTLFSRELFTPASWWVVLAFCLALAVRLFKLTSYLSFPIPDEVINAYNAIHLKDQWSWNLFYYNTQMPPFYIWLLTIVFKIEGVSNLDLWMVPALLSFLSVVFYYLAFRGVFSRGLSFVYLLLLGAGFWPVFQGRFSTNAILMVFWEALAFWLLAKLYKAGSFWNRAWIMAFLGLCLGLGFYTYFAWLLIVLWFIPAILRIYTKAVTKGKVLFILCMTVAVLFVLPLFIAAMREGFGFYLKHIFTLHPESPKLFDANYSLILQFLTSFLWTGSNGDFAYNPQWGGFLNPVLGSLFLMGLVELVRLRSVPLVKWVGIGIVIQLASLFLSHNPNWYHLAGLMPIFIGVTAFGFGVLWEGFPKVSARVPFVLGFFLLSLVLDWANLEKSMAIADRNNSAMNPTVWTCETLQKMSQEKGPGRVYSEFCLDFNPPHSTLLYDNTGRFLYSLFTCHWFPCYMALGAYPFNTLANPALERGPENWAAIMTDEWARPLLSGWFPDAQFTSNPNQQVHALSDNSLLAIIPLTPENRKILDGWGEADKVLREINYLQFNRPYQQSFDDIIQRLKDREPLFQESPFLRFCYWGKLGYLYCLNKRYDLALPAYQKALQDGQDGFLYYGLGYIYGALGRFAEAKEAYLQAGKWDTLFQPSPGDLRNLDALAARSKPAGGIKPVH